MRYCCVVPCYNEEKRLNEKAFKAYCAENDNVCFLFVNDGSVDKTGEILEKLALTRANIEVFGLNTNVGKSEAVRLGIKEAILRNKNIDVVGFLDADLSTPLTEIESLILNFKGDISFVFASRFQRIGSSIQRKSHRHYIGRVFATLVSLILNLKVYDTQCGAKFFKVKLANQIFQRPFLSKWIFDVEIFFRLIEIFGIKKIDKISIEVPIKKWKDIDGSKIPWTYFFIVPIDILKLFINYRVVKR